MRTKKEDLISDDLKPFVSNVLKENRKKYNMSLEDLSKAINGKKNRQTLHKYENGMLNISYDLFIEICRIFNYDINSINDLNIGTKEKKRLEEGLVKNYMQTTDNSNKITYKEEKLLNTYKNLNYEPINRSNLSVKLIDDSMSPLYEKNDKIFFEKYDNYKNGDDIIIATKSNILSVRRLYKYQKGIILQAMNPKYNTININIISNDMILGKVTSIYREIKK